MKGKPKDRRAKELIPPQGRQLTTAQLAFCRAKLDGARTIDAYRKAYPNSRLADKNKGVEANRIMRLPHIFAYLDRERARADDAALLSRVEKRQLLAEIARRKQAKHAERIKAIEVDNVMTGHNAPQQVEVFGLAEIMRLVREGNG